MNERFSPTARQESMALAKCPHLGALATARLAELGTLPQPRTAEADAISDSLKPVRYALIAQIIEGILDDDETEAETKLQSIDGDFYRVSQHLRQKYSDRLMAFCQGNGKHIVASLQKQLDVKVSLQPGCWDDAFWAMEGGIGTMVTANTTLLKVFNEYLTTEPLPDDERIGALRRSYGPLIDIATHDSFQLMAVINSILEGRYPELTYNNRVAKVEFSRPLFDQEISEKTMGHLSMFEDLPTQRPLRISDISNDHQIIGCPVLFKPGQIQKLWNETIDTAIDLGAI